ncbi:MAG: hypothetical protein V1787_03925 [Candidatus Micrarchaeota archaeon]
MNNEAIEKIRLMKFPKQLNFESEGEGEGRTFSSKFEILTGDSENPSSHTGILRLTHRTSVFELRMAVPGGQMPFSVIAMHDRPRGKPLLTHFADIPEPTGRLIWHKQTEVEDPAFQRSMNGLIAQLIRRPAVEPEGLGGEQFAAFQRQLRRLKRIFPKT